MKLRELAEILLVTRKSAKRIDCTFKLHEDRLERMGISGADVHRVMETVWEIERFTEDKLAALSPS